MYIASMQCNAMQWINSNTTSLSKFAFFVMKGNFLKFGFLCHRLWQKFVRFRDKNAPFRMKELLLEGTKVTFATIFQTFFRK